MGNIQLDRMKRRVIRSIERQKRMGEMEMSDIPSGIVINLGNPAPVVKTSKTKKKGSK